MKILDKNKDFYDYYQNILKDDTFTFDRRDSYNLSKAEFASYFISDIHYNRYYFDQTINIHYLLLQACNTFWLIKLTEKDWEEGCSTKTCIDYELKLLAKWNDYNKKRVPLKLSQLSYSNYHLFGFSCYKKPIDVDAKTLDKFVNAVKASNLDDKKSDVRISRVFNNFILTYGEIGKQEVKTIPILKNIGIPAVVDAQELYLAIEQYFSYEKTDSERSESVGLTNKEKIINHGFDVKTSFRGK